MNIRSDLSSSLASAACEGRETWAGADPPTAPTPLFHDVIIVIGTVLLFAWAIVGIVVGPF